MTLILGLRSILPLIHECYCCFDPIYGSANDVIIPVSLSPSARFQVKASHRNGLKYYMSPWCYLN